MCWLHFYLCHKESQSKKDLHGHHLLKDHMQVTLTIYQMNAMVLMKTTLCTTFSRDTELKREIQLVLELVSGNSQNHLDHNGLLTLLEDSMLSKKIKLTHMLPPTSITSGLNTTITELEKFMSLKEKPSLELFSDPITDLDLPQVPFLIWSPTPTIFKMNSMLLQTKNHSLTDTH